MKEMSKLNEHGPRRGKGLYSVFFKPPHQRTHSMVPGEFGGRGPTRWTFLVLTKTYHTFTKSTLLIFTFGLYDKCVYVKWQTAQVYLWSAVSIIIILFQTIKWSNSQGSH